MIKKQENLIAFQSTDIDGGVGAITSPGRARTKTAAPLLSNFRKIKKWGYPQNTVKPCEHYVYRAFFMRKSVSVKNACKADR